MALMRPMKLAGRELMFGQGSLAYLATLQGSRAVIVMRGSRFARNGVLDEVTKYLAEANIEWIVFDGVEPDPVFSQVVAGAEVMMEYKPDLIIALGGGSAMDAAKAMWVYYEHPEMTKLEDMLPPNKIPPLRAKARMVCIPSTSGSASEVSRSVVITDDETGLKYGVGDMEMMPDIAICDPFVTLTMPPKVTADTGMDALAHATEAYISSRANHLSDILAKAAVLDIFEYLPKAYSQGDNLEYREHMLNASMVAGLAFTNVSLGIVHSMSHALGSLFGLAHGFANAVLLPSVIRFNSANEETAGRYADLAELLGVNNYAEAVAELNKTLGIPVALMEMVPDEQAYLDSIPKMATMALGDGCTKTNPIIPTIEQFEQLLRGAYYGTTE